MSDLSRLLDDVYGDTAPAVPVEPDPPTAPLTGLPDWAVDSVLDEAFADWVPGAPAAVDEALAAQDRPAPHVLRTAFSELAEAPAVAAVAPHTWCRDDDDILPNGRRGGRRGRRGRSLTAPVRAVPAADVPALDDEVADDADRGGRLRRLRR